MCLTVTTGPGQSSTISRGQTVAICSRCFPFSVSHWWWCPRPGGAMQVDLNEFF